MAAVSTKTSPRPRRHLDKEVEPESPIAYNSMHKVHPWNPQPHARLDKAVEPESPIANDSMHKVYPWSPPAEHAAAEEAERAEEADRRRHKEEEDRRMHGEEVKIETRSRLIILASHLPSFSDLTVGLSAPTQGNASPESPEPGYLRTYAIGPSSPVRTLLGLSAKTEGDTPVTQNSPGLVPPCRPGCTHRWVKEPLYGKERTTKQVYA